MATTKRSSSTHPTATTDEIEKMYALLAEQDGRTLRKHFIGEFLGITDERVVRDALSQIVLRGLGAVVRDRQAGGYKLTVDLDEIRAEVAHLSAYRKRISARMTALRKIGRSLSAAPAATEVA